MLMWRSKWRCFLYVIGHNVRLRVVAFYFSHSVSTVHRHFISVLRAIQRITSDYMKQPGSNDTLLQQSVTQRSFSHYFKVDCVGAIDGSYIPAMVKIEDQPRYRTRKGRIAQNVMAAVGFDMKFTYDLTDLLEDELCDDEEDLESNDAIAYQAVINAIYEKLGISLNKEQVRSRIKRWKKEYLAISTLLDQSSFGWDDTKKMVTADDSVWDEYLKSHSDARPYRTKSIPDFDSLSLIIANDSANGNGMFSGFDAEHTTNQDDTFSRGTNIEDMRTGLDDLHEWDNPIRNEVPTPSAPLGASSSRLNNEARKKKKTRGRG
ncbi:hypothetical protein HHK36_009832 [Tetracentron sinense]|uniref:Myb/SANT-like domain-containing protein n=1 Tax=Tetracentron sinense TaxID=13715 RepID=A0A834ZDE7_TETSI|nr:hypothetical protein HHK36_009832 [Tetracentron sinense]